MGTKVLLVLPALQMLLSEQSILVMPRVGENNPHLSTDPLKNLPRFHLLSAAGGGRATAQQRYHRTGPCLSPALRTGCASSQSSGGAASGPTFFSLACANREFARHGQTLGK